MKIGQKAKNRKKQYGLRYTLAFYLILQLILYILLFLVYTKSEEKNTFLFGSVLILSALLSIFFVTASVIKLFTPLDKLLDRIDHIASGNINTPIRVPSDSEMAELVESTESLRLRFSQVILEMREMEKKRKQLIAGISHDLKTPLTSIIGYVEALQDGVFTDSEECLEIIRNKALYLNHIIEDLSTYSKQELDEIIIRKEVHLSSKLLNNFIKSISKEIAQKELFLVEQKPYIQAFLHVDPYRFNQILENLFSNALKYTKTTISLSTSVNSDYLEIAVRDDGIGIPSDVIDSIFDPFFMVNKVKDFRGKGGSGLGLAIVKQLVEIHGGSIRAISTYGEGTTFIVSFPIHRN